MLRGIFPSVIALLLLIVALLSGAISVARDFQMMYLPPRTNERRVLWAWVRIAFTVAMCLLLWNEHAKVVNPRYTASDPIQRDKRAEIRKRLGEFMVSGR